MKPLLVFLKEVGLIAYGVIVDAGQKIVVWIFILPLKVVYFHGNAVLFWAGTDMSDICFQLTAVSGDFWAAHEKECAELVTRKFTAFCVSVYCVILLYLLYSMVSNVCYKKIVIDPSVRALQDVFREQQRLLGG